MNAVFLPGVRMLAAGMLFFAGTLPAVSAGEGRSRDTLWNIVTTCLGPEDAEYCRRCATPRAGSACSSGRRCEETTEVWAETREYVALRDIKMCSCLPEFVHGLALPRTPVTGVEALQRPDGIWAFAWAVAQDKIRDDDATALVVNSARLRTQDQLHVHLVRLRNDARLRFSGRLAPVLRLDQVWGAATRLAAEQPPLNDYGVLVTSDLKGGYVVLVESNERSLERSYTQRTCAQ